jgi:hypothetical protein
MANDVAWLQQESLGEDRRSRPGEELLEMRLHRSHLSKTKSPERLHVRGSCRRRNYLGSKQFGKDNQA